MSVGLFEAAELGQQVSKQDHQARIARLRVELINAPFDLRAAEHSVVVLLDGSDRTAVNAVLRGMHHWINGRALEGHAYGSPSEEQRQRPLVWRYGNQLPRSGRVGALVDGRALEGIRLRALGEIDEVQDERWIDAVARIEQERADAGTQFVDLRSHVPKRILEKRILEKRIAEERRVPETARPLPALAERHFKGNAACMRTAERMLRATSAKSASRTVIESSEQRHAELKAAETIAAALQRRLARKATAVGPEPAVPVRSRDPGGTSVPEVVDITSSITSEEHHERLLDLRAEVARLSAKAARKGGASGASPLPASRASCLYPASRPRPRRSAPATTCGGSGTASRATVAWPASTAAGQAGCWWSASRVSPEKMNGGGPAPRSAASSRTSPSTAALSRSPGEEICFDEQLRRFDARKGSACNQYKLSDEDYREHEQWPDCAEAVHEMVARTHTEDASWHLVPATDKRCARIRVLQAFCSGLASKR